MKKLSVENKPKIKSWLKYWKQTLIDVDRKKIDATPIPINVNSFFLEKVPEKQIKQLWESSKTNKETKFINVDICPCSVQQEYQHGKSRNIEREEVFYPFWIPAIMYKDGTLAPQASNNGIAKPFFVREYLDPNPKNFYQISSIKEVDVSLRGIEFKEGETWESFWRKCESFFVNITKNNFNEFGLKHEKQIIIQKGELRGLTENIRKLYHRLEEDPPKKSLLKNLIEPERIEFSPTPKKSKVIRNNNHLGQMSRAFPLSASQRESLACFNLLKKSNILAVNGPPGTGKTTFLQSIVANSVVTTVANNEKPELIIACSANNQAITNILDSFILDSKDGYTQRWLPELTSLGLYLSSNENSKYQTCSSEYGNGFLNDFENNNIEKKEAYFLDQFKDHFGKQNDVLQCKNELLTIVKSKVSKIKKSLEITEKYEGINDLLKKENFDNLSDLLESIKALESRLNSEFSDFNELSLVEKKLKEVNQSQPFLQKTFSFLPTFRERRTALFKRALLKIRFEQTPNYSNYNSLIHLLNEKIIEKANRIEKLKVKLKSQNQLKGKVTDIQMHYKTCITNWNENYLDKLKEIQRNTGMEYTNLSPLEDMQVRLDISYRFEAFWYAIHFREAEFLLKVKERNSKDRERGKNSYKEKLQRFSGITPIYISTFHSIPRYSTFYDNKDGEKAYLNLFDLIIVDEAGQVAPDIAIPSFALAKKALVVGDVFQIEPVWSVQEKLDIANLKMNNILSDHSSESEIKYLKDSGMLCSSGNLMQLAQKACFVKNGDQGGTLLKEHRRCPDKIISYCNENVYDNKLILTKGNKRKYKTDLPFKGFLHIDSKSKKLGNSRRNTADAIIIAEWIDSQKSKLITSFGSRPIHEILAIVTPYKSQAILIKKELLKLNKEAYKDIISGTVHALQGAEIDIVIFSTVITPGDSTVFANNLNMLNVAVSRAKSSFLAFGNMNALDATKTTPLGLLKKWLQEDEGCELSNRIIFQKKELTNDLKRIDSLQKHVNALKYAFNHVKSELIIVSPFISSYAIECDKITYMNNKKITSLQIESVKNQLIATVNRGVKVRIFTDAALDINFSNNQLKPNAKKGREIIQQTGAELKTIAGIHSKTIIIDDEVIIEGSFNWFSALRDQQNKFFREESSIYVQGELAREMIQQAKSNLKNRE